MSTGPDPVDETDAAAPASGQQPSNDYALVAIIVGLLATTVGLFSPDGAIAYAPGLVGLVVSGVAIAVGVRRDARMSAAVAGLLLNLLALTIAVFAAGIHGS